MQRFASWAMLSLLLAAALGGALTLDRRSWPGLVGDEATYLMQAQSLAWDHDLRYSRRDYDRFAEQWSTRPEGLILRSGDGGKTLTYGKPASYAAWIAPFLRLSPTRGASVAFAYTFWAHSDLFLMSLSALALALAYGARPEESSLRVVLRWLAVGALLYLVTASRPFYGILLVAAALAVPPAQRKLGLPAIVLAAGLLLGVSGFANLAEGDSWTPYGGERQSFDSSTGFPEVELPADSWQEIGRASCRERV